MDTRQNQSRNGACGNYRWDGWSAGRKLVSGVDIGFTRGPVTVNKQIPANDGRDAYRRCSNCQKHFNYHGKNDNQYKYGQLNPLK